MAISLRLNDAEAQLIKKYAEMHDMTVSDFVRRAVIERIEDEFDLGCYYEAMEEFKKDPVTYTHEETLKMLGLDK